MQNDGDSPQARTGRIYRAIFQAVRSGRLSEPFNAQTFEAACPGFGPRTYGVFLPKHRVGNPGGNTELFVRVDTGLYKLRR